MGLLPKQQMLLLSPAGYRALEKWDLNSKSLTRTNKCYLGLLRILHVILASEEKGFPLPASLVGISTA